MAIGALLLPGLLAGTALGILAADAGAAPQRMAGGLPAIAIAASLLLTLSVVARRPAGAAAAFVALGLALGACRGAGAAMPTGPGTVSALVGDADRLISGVAVEEPRARGERQQVVLEGVSIGPGDAASQPVAGRLLARLPRSAVIGAGDRVTFRGRVEAPQDFEGFAYREYLTRQGIGAVSSAFRVEVDPGSRGALPDAMASLRSWLLGGLNAVIPEPEAALGAGILLGVRAGMDPGVSDAFAVAGLTHVVAISGWNIAIVAAVAGAATRPLTRLPGGRVLAIGVAASAVGGYVLLTGASPSVVRAALMAGALVLARLGGSRAHAFAGLMLAALAMLLAAPPVLWDVGFQLSALATAGLIWFASPMERMLGRWPGIIREPVALTLAAQLTTLPVVLLNFERLSLVAPAANVLVVPLVPVVMLCAGLAAVAGAVTGHGPLPWIGEALTWSLGGAAWLYLRLMILAGQAAASVPLASLELAAPPWLAAAWYPLLTVLHRRAAVTEVESASLPVPGLRRVAGPVPLAAGTLLVLGLLTLATQPDGRLRLTMLDVGQGDALLVRTPSGANMLVDGGPDPDLAIRRLGEALPFWDRSLDVVLLTHPHEDHVAGLLPALERHRIGMVLEPGRAYDNPSYERFRRIAAERGSRAVLARAGQRIELDATTRLTILFPSAADAAGPLPEGDINNASVVALLESGGFRALLTGDAEAPVESLLLARGVLAPVDVLKVGHHGSDSSTGTQLLDALRPRLALISTGEGNEYGHPHRATLRHLEAIPGLRILRTDRDGSVELVVEPSGIRVVSHGPADPGSIGPWPSRVSRAPRSCCRSAPSRMASCGTRGAWHAWRPRRRGCCAPRTCRSTRRWSRSPPCSTTSTSPRRATRSPTAWWQPPRWWSVAGRSWPSPSPRTRWPACSTRSASRGAGPR